jgi:4-amino-4-deoxy-L-arabinose transferase-like glycosyltransferase
LVLTRRAPRTDRVRAALALWGGWLVVTGAVFSYMDGIVHPYYTVALAPAVAACVGIGATLVWDRRADIRAATTLAGLVAITVVLSFVLLERNSSWLPWLRWTVLIVGLIAALLLLTVGRLAPTAARVLGVVAAAAVLAGPAAYTVATAATPHTGAIPSAGPRAGFGGPPGFLSVARPGPTLTATLSADAADYTWVAAAVGSNNAAGYQLATGAPVMAVGGFNGTDPAPTLAQFQRDVADRRIHYFVGGSTMWFGRGERTGSDDADRIAEWVQANFPAQTVDGATLYDLTS